MKLHTKSDFTALMHRFLDPLLPLYSEGGARLHLGDTGVTYPGRTIEMEAFSRPLWALAPFWKGGGRADDFLRIYRKGLASGTDPESPEYWGDPNDYAQLFVEMAALACAILETPESVWEPLTDAEKANLAKWLDTINHHDLPGCNWLLFRVLVNLALDSVGMPCDMARAAADMAEVDKWYVADGWYSDGPADIKPQKDYYNPWAIQYYTVLYSVFAAKSDPARAALYRDRATKFGQQFARWFDENGAALPFGRSLTYRIGQSAFYSACIWAGLEPLPLPVMKGIIVRNLNWWLARPIFDRDGVLTIGYQYPNLLMSERYNAPGSPYWAFKAFLFLALPADHPFWTAPDATVPHPAQQRQDKPHMLVCHDGGHITVFPVGQHCMNHGAISAKYEKFVYSNRFGFSVGRGTDLEDGAFDNTLAASPAGMNFYRMRYGTDNFAVTDAYTYAAYTLLPGTTAQSWVVPCGGSWHVRVHKIVTTSPVDIADGGFALSVEEPFTRRVGAEDGKVLLQWVEDVRGGKAVFLPWGCTAAVSLLGGAQTEFVRTFPNTNLMANLCAVPYLKATLQPGTHILVDAFYARPADADEHGGFAVKPFATRKGNAIEISCADGRTIRIDPED